MDSKVGAQLKRLDSLKTVYAGDAATQKRQLLHRLAGRRLADADQVHRLHEVLCFLHAYPDDPEIRAEVETMLESFAGRGDLRRHRRELAGSGIAGTVTYYRFFWPTAQWLVARYPDLLSIDWPEFANQEKLSGLWSVLLPFCESPALDALDFSPRAWLEQLKGQDETDAAFLLRRFAALPGDDFTREKTWEDLDVPLALAAVPGSPTRTGAKVESAPVFYQERPLARKRPRLRPEIRRSPLRVRTLSPDDGRRMIDLAVEAMIARARDLDAFAYGDPHDVRLVDCGDGLEFALIGQVPERRLMFEAVYGCLTLKNGVPIGYVLASSLFNSSAVAYNVFETFRGAEAAAVFGRLLGLVGHLFGADAFSIDPYQLGHDNQEGLQSGAWWFYYKLGFRPEDPDIRRLLRSELAAMKRNPRHRSSVATLQKLSADHTYFYLDRKRPDVIAKLPLGELGLKLSRLLADRHGGHRERALRETAREAADLLGVRTQRSWSSGERLAWRRWSPLVVLLPGVARWSAADRRALVRVIRAKGGRRESDFVRFFDDHVKLRRAVLKLVE